MRHSHEQNTIHAEQNAIADAARRGVSIQDTTIYITHRPCINCAKFIISSGIIKIKYLSDYRNDDLVDQLLNASNISIEKV
jgi:dCMP deaminase